MNKGQLTELKEFITKTVKETVTEAVSVSEVSLKVELKKAIAELREKIQEGFKGVAESFEKLDKTQRKTDKTLKRHANQLDHHGELILQLQSTV